MQRGLDDFPGASRFTGPQQCACEVEPCIPVVRVDLQGLLVGGYGRVQVAPALERTAKIVVGLGQFRVKRKRAAECVYGLVQLVCTAQGKPQVAVIGGLTGVDVNGLA